MSFRSLPDVPSGDTSGLDLDLFEGIMSTIATETEIVNTETVTKDAVSIQDQVALVQEDSLSKDQPTHSISDPAEGCSNQQDKTAHSWNTKKFPFHNRSSPNDVDSDVLPHPAQIIKSKAATKVGLTHKYFLLTSNEVRHAKLKEAEDKLAREKNKEEKARTRKQKLEEKAKSKTAVSDGRKGKSKSQRKPTKKPGKADCTPCGACGVMFCDDRSGLNWIECSGCKAWYHNACQGLDEKSDSAFFCISCENDSD